MHNILFDPSFLVAPDATASHKEVNAWLNTLEMWAQVAGATPHSWYHLTDLVARHLGYERFPSFRLLRILQQRYRLDVGLPMIMTMVNEIFLQDTWSFRPALE